MLNLGAYLQRGSTSYMFDVGLQLEEYILDVGCTTSKGHIDIKL